jgi:hypothetical protein
MPELAALLPLLPPVPVTGAISKTFHFSNPAPYLVQFLLLHLSCRAQTPKTKLPLRHPGTRCSSRPSTLPKIRSVASAGAASMAVFSLTVSADFQISSFICVHPCYYVSKFAQAAQTLVLVLRTTGPGSGRSFYTKIFRKPSTRSSVCHTTGGPKQTRSTPSRINGCSRDVIWPVMRNDLT